MRHVVVLAGSALVLFLAAWTWLVFYPALPDDLGGVVDLDRDARHVHISVGSSDSLDGWFLRGTRPAVVLLLHGHGRTPARMWRYGHALRRAGYHVLAIDFRSAAVRHRRPTTLGAYELEDARAALDWIAARPGLRGHAIGVLGESLGGAVALVAAAEDSTIAAVIDDSGFASGALAIESAFGMLHLPRWPCVPIARAVGKQVTGFDPGALDVRPAAAALSSRPVLFIHGADDRRISPEQTRMLWRAAGSRHPLWLVEGAGHNEGWKVAPRAYEDRVTSFFARHLRAPARRGRPRS